MPCAPVVYAVAYIWFMLYLVVQGTVLCVVRCAMGWCQGCCDEMQGSWCSMRPLRRWFPSLHPAALCAPSAKPSPTSCKNSPPGKINRFAPPPQNPTPLPKHNLPRVPDPPCLCLTTVRLRCSPKLPRTARMTMFMATHHDDLHYHV